MSLIQPVAEADATAWLSAARARLAVTEVEQAAADGLRTVAVIGAGTMGRDIAAALAISGRDVTLIDPMEEARQAAAARVGAIFDKAGLAAGLVITDALSAVASADLVIEAVPERPDLKARVLADIARRTRPGTIIATNTSTLDLDALAGAVPDPSRVIGTHFFMPAHITRLIELVPAAETSAETRAAARGLAHALGKIPVIAGNCDGFIGNRLFDRLHQEAMYLVEEGAWPEDIDVVLEHWGMKIGPFRTLDMIGNDIPCGVRRQRAARDPGILQPLVGDRLVEAGLLGQKSGKGWYIYDTDPRRGRPYEASRAVILRSAAELGIARRSVEPDEILTRCLTALMCEAVAILGEGMAEAMSDVDVVYVTGYGFPETRGGPAFLARQTGVGALRQMAARCADQSLRHQARWACHAATERVLAGGNADAL